jgi:hypothetical protein
MLIVVTSAILGGARAEDGGGAGAAGPNVPASKPLDLHPSHPAVLVNQKKKSNEETPYSH